MHTPEILQACQECHVGQPPSVSLNLEPLNAPGGLDNLSRQCPTASKAAQQASGGVGAAPLPQLPSPPEDLVTGLRRQPKYLPCRFLYDDQGSQLYEQITQLEEYYPYRVEKRLLEAHARELAAWVPKGALVVELGCGDSSKTALLLEALLERDGAHSVKFCGIDCSGEALRQTRDSLRRLLPSLPPEAVLLLEAEYLEGLRQARRHHPDTPLAILWLGSSVGNFSYEESVTCLASLCKAAGEDARLLLCTDLWKSPARLSAAYDDSQGVTRAFILNGMRHALCTLGHPAAHAEDLWDYEAVVKEKQQQVEMWVVARRQLADVLPGVHFEAGEPILVEISRKFTPEVVAATAQAAGLCPGAAWGTPDYRMQWLLAPVAALRRCWAETDALFGSIPDWGAQPIELRLPFCFYYGHLAAFDRPRMLPELALNAWDAQFSRGMDPLVQDPSTCHSHPAPPLRWPSREELVSYVASLRLQLLEAVRSGSVPMQTLAMCLEHAYMHHETMCYMLAQQRKLEWEAATGSAGAAATASAVASRQKASRDGGSSQHGTASIFYLQGCSYASASQSAAAGAAADAGSGASSPGAAGPATPRPRSSGLAGMLSSLAADGALLPKALARAFQGSWGGSTASSPAGSDSDDFVHVRGGKVVLGVGPSSQHAYVWDNELGQREEVVVDLLVASHPVTVAQFRHFALEQQGYERPQLWQQPGDYEYFRSSGRRLPATWSLGPGGELLVHMPEASYPWEAVADCPAYVSLAEAEAYCSAQGGRVMREAEWVHLHGSSAAAEGRIAQLAQGGWEWTSSPFEPFEGFSPNLAYPEYSADFFDGHHAVLRGSSPYTHPSTPRASFRNFYQRLYPYVFAKFRLVRDAQAAAS